MSRPNQVQQTILEMVGELEVVRRQTLHMLPHHRVTINDNIREMLASGLIAEKQKGRNKHYILTSVGKERLRASAWVYEEHEFLPSKTRSDSWERLILAGDIMTMLWLCGYHVRRADRPWLEDLDKYPNLWEERCPNSFYPATVLKQYLGGNLPSLQYSRICGLIFTPDMPYRVYHTRDVAMEIRRSGENNVNRMIDNKILLKMDFQKSGTLIFGDRDMVSLEKIISNTLEPNNIANKLRGLGKDKKKSHKITELLTAAALGYHSSYLPLNQDALPLLQLYRYTDGLGQIERAVKNLVAKNGEYDEYERKLFGIGTNYYLYVADLDIGAICARLKNLGYYLRRGAVTVVCLDWQVDVWKRIFSQHFAEHTINFLPFDNHHIEYACNWCEARDKKLL